MNKKLYELKLGEHLDIDEFLDILRVPGGWIYRFREIVEGKEIEYFYQKVFVPFNDEFK